MSLMERDTSDNGTTESALARNIPSNFVYPLPKCKRLQ